MSGNLVEEMIKRANFPEPLWTPESGKDLLLRGYRVLPAINGGFVVTPNVGPESYGQPAALSSVTDLMRFLIWLHGLPTDRWRGTPSGD